MFQTHVNLPNNFVYVLLGKDYYVIFYLVIAWCGLCEEVDVALLGWDEYLWFLCWCWVHSWWLQWGAQVFCNASLVLFYPAVNYTAEDRASLAVPEQCFWICRSSVMTPVGLAQCFDFNNDSEYISCFYSVKILLLIAELSYCTYIMTVGLEELGDEQIVHHQVPLSHLISLSLPILLQLVLGHPFLTVNAVFMHIFKAFRAMRSYRS